MPKKNGDVPVTTKDLRDLMKQIDHRITTSEERLKLYFDVAVENIRHDLVGANADKLSLHDDKLADHQGRISALERRAGLRV